MFEKEYKSMDQIALFVPDPRSPKKSNLKTLQLRHTPLTPQYLTNLFKNPTLNSQLTKISLNYCKIGDKGMQLLCSHRFIRVEEISLMGNFITARGVRFFVGAGWKQLGRVNLSNNCIGDQGVRNLVKGKFEEIRELKINHNTVLRANELLLWQLDPPSRPGNGQPSPYLVQERANLCGILHLAVMECPSLQTILVAKQPRWRQTFATKCHLKLLNGRQFRMGTLQ